MAGLRVTLWLVPAEEVKVIPMMVTWRLRMEGLAGRVSATMVTLTEPLPLPVQLEVQAVLVPLHELRAMAVNRVRKTSVLGDFIRHPTSDRTVTPHTWCAERAGALG